MAPYVTQKVKLLILCGATANAIANAVTGYEEYDGNPEIVFTQNLAEAVKVAHDRAQQGDIVTLSPACASFDALPNFAQRGKFFKERVNEL